MILLTLLAALQSAPAREPIGYYALDITLDEAPARMGLRLSRREGVLVAEVWPAMGPGPLTGKETTLKENRLRTLIEIHDGMNMVLELEFTGDTVKGTWSVGEQVGAITGRKAPDPTLPRS